MWSYAARSAVLSFWGVWAVVVTSSDADHGVLSQRAVVISETVVKCFLAMYTCKHTLHSMGTVLMKQLQRLLSGFGDSSS